MMSGVGPVNEDRADLVNDGVVVPALDQLSVDQAMLSRKSKPNSLFVP
jgi:hypothetical protein